MPKDSDHLKQAKHNEEVLSFLAKEGKQSEYSDWYITIIFYTSLHFIETVIFRKESFNIGNRLSGKGRHSANFKTVFQTKSEHFVRTMLIRNNPEVFDEFNDSYGNLYEMSRTARYDCHKTPNNDYIEAEQELGRIKKAYSKMYPRDL